MEQAFEKPTRLTVSADLPSETIDPQENSIRARNQRDKKLSQKAELQS